ncbi:retrotransposon protein, putative, ty1-copia subclass [Tanacetum coccineum]
MFNDLEKVVPQEFWYFARFVAMIVAAIVIATVVAVVVIVVAVVVESLVRLAKVRSMFEREKLSGNNFNDWFRQLKLVLRVEKKMYFIEQPLPVALAADSEAQVLSQWNAVYDAYNEVACLILGSMTPELHRQFENFSPYDMIKELKAMFEKQAGMKGYLDQPERLGYMLPQDLIVGLILNGVTKDFAGFVRNYNMHNMGKTIGELHAMLIEYEKGLPKKADTPQVMMIKGGKIQKAKKKSLKAKGKGKANGKGNNKQVYIPKPKNPKPSAKEHLAKDDTCHHCKEVGHWKRNCPVYLAELLKKKKQVGSASSSESVTWILNMVPTKKVDKTPYELWYGKVPNLSYLKDTQRKQWVTIFYFPPENKIVVARYAEFFKKILITQEVSARAMDLKEIQDEDTSPSKITSKIPMEVEGFEPPQKEVIPVRRSERTHRAPNHLYLNVEAEEHSLGDLNEPTGYKAAMLDSESNKWIDAMNAEIQSMIDNMVWVLVDLPPNCKTVGSKWIFKKKTDMDGIVHTYKDRLVAKGYTQLYRVDYEETFSPVTDIRAIKILISIAAYYDYEIRQMDVKTAFLNVSVELSILATTLNMLEKSILTGIYKWYQSNLEILKL